MQNSESIESGNVYLVKTCPEHGATKTLVSTDASHWSASIKYNRPGTAPLVWSSAQNRGCPDDLGVFLESELLSQEQARWHPL